MQGLDSGDDDSSAPKGIESEHRSRNPLDGTVILFDDVVEVLVLTHHDINASVGLGAFNGGRVGAALVDGDLLRQIVQIDGPLQKAPRCSQIPLGSEKEVDRGFCWFSPGGGGADARRSAACGLFNDAPNIRSAPTG